MSNPILNTIHEQFMAAVQKDLLQDVRIEKVRDMVKELSDAAIKDDKAYKILEAAMEALSCLRLQDRIKVYYPSSKL